MTARGAGQGCGEAATPTWLREDDHLWRRDDLAYVAVVALFSTKRPWVAFDQHGHPLSGRLYADFKVGTGATRTFGSAQAAMKAADRDIPYRPRSALAAAPSSTADGGRTG